jgi:hypothetical protein
MRTLLAALLLTSVAMPSLAAAAPDNNDDRRSERAERVREARSERQEERAERREERRERAVEQVRSVRNEAAGDNGVLRADRPERAGRPLAAEAARELREERRERRADRRHDRAQIVTPPAVATAGASPTSRTERVARGGIQGQVADRLQRGGVATALANPEFARRWRDDWRRDNRHDWRRYRDHNRSLFRFGYYYDPFGYNYRRFGLGTTLYPSYYANRYWLNDPWQYRLPFIGGPYRWVRYWDDALLVDLRTGRVVDVVYDFFW